MKKRLLSIIMATVLLLAATLGATGCSKPPEYAEIEARFIELVEASYDVNKILFGEGLETYERVYDPWDDMQVYESKDADGKATFIYYYTATDGTYGDIIVYRTGYGVNRKQGCVQVLTAEDTAREAVYADGGKYYYKVDYTEPEAEFFYSQKDPENYDYVVFDGEYVTVDDIKQAAEKVYSKAYLEGSVYQALFTGVTVTDNANGFSARYIEYNDGVEDDIYLMMSNEYEPLIKETRIFDFSTAKVVKPGSKKVANIEVETYLESQPDQRLTVRVTMVLENGQWYLDNATY